MTPERWQQIGELLDQAREHAAGERPAFLDRACGADRELRGEVESLLELDDQPAFLDQPVVNVHGRDPEVGQSIGPYRIEALLGRGGMGTVYLARRQDDYRQLVALKLIKRGMDSDEIVRRFENERQILADLDHPNIARLLDGGTAADGRPYLVLEYVEGEPIDRYCDHHQLSTRRRLELFLQVCSAVYVSHQKLVVHRDLKPGNILVDADGVPKLLDFGIAKLLESELAFRTLATLPDRRPMTLRYASPEQVRGEVVTTASDTYALGVLLYRLLTGHHPNDLEDPEVSSTVEVIRRICRHEPRRPSTAIRGRKTVRKAGDTVELTPESVSRTRDGDPRRLGRRLKGDVDAIVLKALRKEPKQRYGSVEQFAEDIRRFLDGLPVKARRGTFTYRAGKYVRRNRLALAVLLVILAFSVTTTMLWQKAVDERQKAVQERQQADIERQRADRTLELLKGLFKASDPTRPELPSTREVLERGTRLLGDALEEDPEQRADLTGILGNTYRNLGLYREARPLMEESLEIMKRQYPGDHPLLAERINNLAVVSHDIGDYRSAEKYSREALAMRRRLGQEDTIGIVKTLNNLASMVMKRGNYAEAEELYRRGLDMRIKRNGPRALNVATSLRNLANLFYVRGDAAQAEPLLRRALDIRLENFERRHVNVASVLDKLGSVRQALGDDHEAEKLFTEALNIQRHFRGNEHLTVAHSQVNLAALIIEQDASREALETAAVLLRQALSTLVRKKPAGDWEIARAESVLGALLARLGRFAEAESCLIESHRLLVEARGADAIYSRNALDRAREFRQARARVEP